MTATACLSVLALSLLPVVAAAATGDSLVSSRQIAMASDGPATSEGVREKGIQACPAAEIAVYSHHTGDFWCATIR
jgi:hypothetical protein